MTFKLNCIHIYMPCRKTRISLTKVSLKTTRVEQTPMKHGYICKKSKLDAMMGHHGYCLEIRCYQLTYIKAVFWKIAGMTHT